MSKITQWDVFVTMKSVRADTLKCNYNPVLSCFGLSWTSWQRSCVCWHGDLCVTKDVALHHSVTDENVESLHMESVIYLSVLSQVKGRVFHTSEETMHIRTFGSTRLKMSIG